MSNALAIASVSYVLKDMLNTGLITDDVSSATGGNVGVTTLPPDRIDTTSAGQSQLNLYLYKVTFNQGWNNVSLPSRDSQGERISNPPLSLNLHYLLTAFGGNELHSEILLGYGMQILHEIPVLDRNLIRRSLTIAVEGSGIGLPEELKLLATSELADQIEQIKITPEPLSTDELSKLWTSFQAKHRPSAAYMASVVLIERKKSTKNALRVRQQNIYVNPFHQPVIEKIRSQKMAGEPVVDDQPIFTGYNLIISGRQLRDENLTVNIGGMEVIPLSDDITDDQILVPLPAGLPAGGQTIQVIHGKMMGSPPVLHRGVESNIAAFVLSPGIEALNLVHLPATAENPASTVIELTTKPAVKETQRVTLLLNEYQPGTVMAQSLAYSFQALAITHQEPPAFSDKVTVPINGVKAGTYLVRIRVDGAESQLASDGTGKYDSPRLTI